MTDHLKQKDAPILGHEYDGIQELDNDLPKWWLYLFYASIVFAPGYYYYYHLGGPGLSPAAEYEAEVAAVATAAHALNPGAPGGGPQPFTPEELSAYVAKETGAVDKGKQQYVAKCIACHGTSGQGTVGPNLADKSWIHGGKLHQIAQTISEGVTDKGMIAWKNLMSREEIMQVSIYIRSLQGTNPPGGKPPQGVVE